MKLEGYIYNEKNEILTLSSSPIGFKLFYDENSKKWDLMQE